MLLWLGQWSVSTNWCLSSRSKQGQCELFQILIHEYFIRPKKTTTWISYYPTKSKLFPPHFRVQPIFHLERKSFYVHTHENRKVVCAKGVQNVPVILLFNLYCYITACLVPTQHATQCDLLSVLSITKKTLTQVHISNTSSYVTCHKIKTGIVPLSFLVVSVSASPQCLLCHKYLDYYQAVIY